VSSYDSIIAENLRSPLSLQNDKDEVSFIKKGKGVRVNGEVGAK
jgi:hypothetical protein